jgi:ABC-type antimicrobial peptide transport system permease subunit
MVLVGAGIMLGLVGGAVLTRFMVTMLYGVSPLDTRAWMAAIAAMAVAGIVAVLVPSLRATRVNPHIALRSE